MATRCKIKLNIKTATDKTVADKHYTDVLHDETYEIERKWGVGTWHQLDGIAAVAAPGTKVELTDLVSASKPVAFLVVINLSETTTLTLDYTDSTGATTKEVAPNGLTVITDIDGDAADLYLIGAGASADILVIGG